MLALQVSHSHHPEWAQTFPAHLLSKLKLTSAQLWLMKAIQLCLPSVEQAKPALRGVGVANNVLICWVHWLWLSRWMKRGKLVSSHTLWLLWTISPGWIRKPHQRYCGFETLVLKKKAVKQFQTHQPCQSMLGVWTPPSFCPFTYCSAGPALFPPSYVCTNYIYVLLCWGAGVWVICFSARSGTNLHSVLQLKAFEEIENVLH